MQVKKVIAVFGGSFNPPINSHISLAKQIIDKCEIVEKLVFVPVSTRYQKMDLVDDEHRYNMLKLICENEDKLEVSDIELKHNKQLYTIETLDLLKEQYGKDYDIWFVMGTDNLKELETWKEPEQLLSNYKILVLNREEDNLEEIVQNSNLLKRYRESLIQIKGIEQIYLSSTMIREKIKNREDVKEYIPNLILKYIKENRLYQ